MNEIDFLFTEVSFNQYYNNSGKKILVSGYNIKGDLYGFAPKRTEDGLQIVGVVRSEKKEVYYVPMISLTLKGKKRDVN